MIKDVCEVGVELQMDTLGDHDVLPHAHVHIPVHLAAQNPGPTAAISVDTQNRVPEAVIDCFRVLEHAWAKKCRAHVRKILRWHGVVVAGTTTHSPAPPIVWVVAGGKNTAAAL